MDVNGELALLTGCLGLAYRIWNSKLLLGSNPDDNRRTGPSASQPCPSLIQETALRLQAVTQRSCFSVLSIFAIFSAHFFEYPWVCM
jgi:hypothetical protein